MAMNLTDSGSNMHSEEQQNPEQVAKFNITFRLYASTMKRKYEDCLSSTTADFYTKHT